MRVKVVPKKPIPGILPKNKWIDKEMELDLNEREIIRCMNFGIVYNENGEVISSYAINSNNNNVDFIIDVKNNDTKPFVTGMSINPVIEQEQTSITSKVVAEPVETYYNLEVLSCTREDGYIVLETVFNTNTNNIKYKNLYGLFNIVSGSKPLVEYKSEDSWIKFNSKFANFSDIKDKDKFIFRFSPKNNSKIEFRIIIKEANSILAKLESFIEPDLI